MKDMTIALEFAQNANRNQTRKYTGLPYVGHVAKECLPEMAQKLELMTLGDPELRQEVLTRVINPELYTHSVRGTSDSPATVIDWPESIA